jgi:plasmid stability protein
MPSITIRNVPEHTRDELAARAARAGKSLQEYLLGELVALTDRPDIGELTARVRARKAALGSRITSEEILAHLHEGRP